MKRSLFVALFALVIVFAGAQSAFALHGGYSNQSISCGECHAVHNAADSQSPSGVRTLFKDGASFENTQAAFPGTPLTKTLTAASTTEDLCEYCHVYEYSTATSRYVYKNGLDTTGFTAGHAIGATTVPEGNTANLTRDGLAGLGCVDCHDALPHAAKYARVSSNKFNGHYYYSQDVPATAGVQGTGVQANVAAMCVRCHDKAFLAGSNHGMNTGNGSYTANATTYGSTQVAWSKAENCLDCHKNASFEYHSINHGTLAFNTPPNTLNNSSATTVTVDGANGSAIVSTGTVFTNYYKTYARGNVEMSDIICLSCHTSDSGAGTVGSNGVGLSY